MRLRDASDKTPHSAPGGQTIPSGGAIQTAADVQRILADAIESVTANPDLDPLQKGRVIAQLARAALHAIELAGLEGRVEAIEAVLKLRGDHQREEKKLEEKKR